MLKAAVILAGCGVKDGSEIHEATLTMFFLDQLGIKFECFSPDRDQHHVINHFNNEEEPKEKRNILFESARIARGQVTPIEKLRVKDFDAILYPGGFGSAKNLFSYAIKGNNFEVFPDISRVVLDAHKSKIIQGFICIAPVMAAKLIPNVRLTIGNDGDIATLIESFGAIHQPCTVNNIVWDETNKVVSTPAYMIGPSIKDIGSGIQLLCQTIYEKCQKKANEKKR